MRAYRAHNASLNLRRSDLKTKSLTLERKVRRLVALTTGVEEAKVHEKAESLAVAIQSEDAEEMDMGRLREFLRNVEEGGE